MWTSKDIRAILLPLAVASALTTHAQTAGDSLAQKLDQTKQTLITVGASLDQTESALRAFREVLAANTAPTAAPSEAAPSLALYQDSVGPILRAQCLSCHNPDKARAGLDMSTRATLLKGGEEGPAIIPGDSANSLVMKLVRHEVEPHMPHKEAKLNDTQIAALAAWIDSGAEFPEAVAIATPPRKIEMSVTDADRAFWSYQPLADPAVPAVTNVSWPRNPIDHFILAKLDAAGIAPSEEASKHALLRRVYFDLTGLPPSPRETAQFMNDTAPDAYERLVDRLLATPQYGERWGRHWLDVSRYADSDGYEFDAERPTAYHYRDFVIRAMNADMPFDQFVHWQLAGDEYAPDNPLAIAATGFCTNGPIIDNQVLEKNRYDELDDMVSTTASAFLGMTAACARCHDHKYEAIPQRDYYRMVAIFNTTKRNNAVLASRAAADPFLQAESEWNAQLRDAVKKRDEFVGPFRAAVAKSKIEALPTDDGEKAVLLAANDPNNMQQVMLRKKFEKELAVSDQDIRVTLNEEQLGTWAMLEKEIGAIQARAPHGPPRALALTDSKAEPVESYLLTRGEPDQKRETVTMGFLSVLPGTDDARFAATNLRPQDARTTFQRTALAEWLTDVDHGAGRLTARVIVNRLWHHHFGAGIVRTPNDFGMQGDRPSHPELLDWLARDLVTHGWSLKYLHKQILMSAAYRQASNYDEAKAAVDPDNRLLWRRVPVRLEAEIIRDTILATTGCLNFDMFGPAILPFVHEDAIATHTNPLWPVGVVDGPDTWRRSIYIQARRSARMPMMEVFDSPDMVASCARRSATTVPSQALELLNGRFANDQAVHFARRATNEGGTTPETFITCAYQLALARPPRESEQSAAQTFLLEQSARHMLDGKSPAESRTAARIDFAHVVLNLNEFVYVE